jgi:hypothetical protein
VTTADKFKCDLPPDADRPWITSKLMARVVKQDDGCWIWTGSKGSSGYGQITIKGQRWIVTRLMHVLHNGAIPPRQYLCHTCDTPPCCNPAHLFVGTMSDNIQDSISKGRNACRRVTHCPKGHPLSGDNVWYQTCEGRWTTRQCRLCNLAKMRRKAGWPEHLWYMEESVPKGYMVDRQTGNIVPCAARRASAEG